MLKIEKTVLPSPEQWEIVIEGMRNPMNSWDLMDSANTLMNEADVELGYEPIYEFILGTNDRKLMTSLNKGGTEHSKYRRMIPVWVTVNAPLYWWKEADRYRFGVEMNSCSTMHKIHAKEFTLDDFSHDHLIGSVVGFDLYPPKQDLRNIIYTLNECRKKFLETKEKVWWWQLIQLLPSSYNQKRTLMVNYEVLAKMYRERKNHKLDEWCEFCTWIETLPYSEFITLKEKI